MQVGYPEGYKIYFCTQCKHVYAEPPKKAPEYCSKCGAFDMISELCSATLPGLVEQVVGLHIELERVKALVRDVDQALSALEERVN